MKKFIILLFFTSLYFQTHLKAYSSDPENFVLELVNDAITTLSDKNLSKNEKASFVEKIALENVDITALSLYTLGELRKTTDKDSLAKYQKTFEKYFLKSLTSRLTDYSSSKFEIISADKKSVNYTIISSKIISESGPDIKID